MPKDFYWEVDRIKLQFYLPVVVLFLNMRQRHGVFPPLKHLLEYHLSVYKMLSDTYVLTFLHSCVAERVMPALTE